jgi:uncharacterized protein YihD (DUF1040 family)
MRKRWDNDERGHGVASAAASVEDLDRLRTAMLEPDWVAEEPDLHLLPHIRRLCDERSWTLARADVVEDVLEVEVVVAPAAVEPTEAAFTVLGTFAEASTHVVVQAAEAGKSVELLATTGMLEGDGAFAPHGHTVRIAVRRG